MAQETVLRKRNRDLNRVCTTYGIINPSCKFTLDTCDNIEATIKDSKGLTVTILSLNAPTATISKKGNYNICIEGDGIGTLYSECGQSSGGGEDCCDELRNEITNINNRLNNQNITGGTGISVTKQGDVYTITNTARDTTTTLVAGNNVTISDSGTNGNHVYTVSSTGASGGLPSDFNIQGGTNVTVNKSGNTYTISSTDTNTQTTLVEGANVTIRDTGTGGNHVYTISTSGGGSGSLPSDFNIQGGTNVTVNKSGNTYTISSSYTDTNTVTTLVPGSNVSITDTGTGGNHVYTISSTGGTLPSDFNIQGGTNVTVNKNGNTYTISSNDTVTTIKQGDNVTVTQNGDEYTISSTDTKPVLTRALTVTCDIGGIESGKVYATGTSIETILRDLLNCGTTPQPVRYPWFTSRVVNRTGWVEEWDQFDVDPAAGTHTFNVAQTFEECPVKFDIPASLAPLTLELYNEIFARWEVNTRDFTITNITRTIDGQSVNYLRYTDAREVTGATRPVRMTWNP